MSIDVVIDVTIHVYALVKIINIGSSIRAHVRIIMIKYVVILTGSVMRQYLLFPVFEKIGRKFLIGYFDIAFQGRSITNI